MSFLKRSARLALCTLPCLYGTANASMSWDYVDLARIVDGKSYALLPDERVYLSGFTLDTAFSVHDQVHLRATSRTWDGRAPGPGGGYVNLSNNDWHSVAVGAHLPFELAGVPMQAWGNVSLDHYSLAGITGTGVGAGAGVRAQVLDPLEVGLWYRMARTDVRLGSTLDIEPWLAGINLLYSLSPNVALHLAMTRGDLELAQSGTSESFRTNTTELGLRYMFDNTGRRAGEAPAPLSYNQIQIAYLFDGDLKDDSGGPEWDLNEGFLISGMLSPLPHMFLAATFQGTNYDASSGMGLESTNPLDHLYMGPGAYYTLTQGDLHYSGYAQITYDRLTLIDGIILHGEGFRVGARAALGHLIDAHIYHGEARAREDIGGTALRLKPRTTGIELGSAPFGNGFGVTLGYEETRYRARIGGDFKLDTSHWRIGVRQQF
ncbi:hypothetical protein K8B33_14735 [Alcanivorax sp. JB21]|uniref:hypothetical protein n=1 Tax=Alcanivorax limicola TaxID=2874102 RepID=UPI001CC161A8|nr:hypothetical protein [Alcanivorax limicola]MBZ2190363.1 hypothetical protein [Alcanivorax limicola]